MYLVLLAKKNLKIITYFFLLFDSFFICSFLSSRLLRQPYIKTVVDWDSVSLGEEDHYLTKAMMRFVVHHAAIFSSRYSIMSIIDNRSKDVCHKQNYT